MSRYAAVVVEAPLTTVYHYGIPRQLDGQVLSGSRVIVPFGHRKIRGFCVEVANTCPIDESRVKDILSVGPEDERVPPDLMALTEWISKYYRCGWGMTLSAAVPVAVRKGAKIKTVSLVTLAVPLAEAKGQVISVEKRAKKQAVALKCLIEKIEASGSDDGQGFSALEIETEGGVTRAALKGLEKKGLVSFTKVQVHRELATLSETEREIVLNREQASALEQVVAALDARKFSPFLLYGVTGSGKTEVYLRALAHALEQGRGVLVLVPEISLTPQTVERFRKRAGEVAVLHSNMSDGERAEAWRFIKRGEVRVVVGARSAVFAPISDLGLIIVDEEHERTFKQDNTPRYHARDVAVVRARECGAAVVLGSATPSLESWSNVTNGKYKLLKLPNRVGDASPPSVTVVDMKSEWAEVKSARLISRELEKQITLNLHRREQTILLLNRRGFNTVVICMGCGAALSCESCDISLTHHRKADLLRCHYCDFSMPTPEKCPACGCESLRFSGTGTERAEDVLGLMFPGARLLRMDSDTMTGRDAHAKALSAFARGEYDILLGTQMVAKGFDFPNVTLVGVLSADAAINMPDFRAGEKTFQLITQCVGRAGRASKPGRAVVQAFQPEFYAVQCAVMQDFIAFADRELSDRKPLNYPPFGRLARVLVRGKNDGKVKAALSRITAALSDIAPRMMMLLGPAPCPVSKIQGEFRQHLVIKAKTHREIVRMLAACGDLLDSKGGVSVVVDIDPVSLL